MMRSRRSLHPAGVRASSGVLSASGVGSGWFASRAASRGRAASKFVRSRAPPVSARASSRRARRIESSWNANSTRSQPASSASWPPSAGLRPAAAPFISRASVIVTPVKPSARRSRSWVMARENVGAVIVGAAPFFSLRRPQLAELAIRYRMPSIFGNRAYVEAGGLMSYGQKIADNYLRAASYVDKIFKGAKPGDLPVEQPITLELVINLKTANALGLTIPQTLLLRADEVIQ